MDLVPLRIDIVSDLVCPWCFLGSATLMEALRRVRRDLELPDFDLETRWHPHFLFPNQSPDVKKDKRSMYLARFKGSSEKVDQMARNFNEALKPLGESYSVEGVVSPTLKAHRLSEFVLDTLGEQAQWGFVHELFRQYHTFGKDLSDHAVLVSAAQQVGLDKDDVIVFLESSQLENEVLTASKSTMESLSLSLFNGGVPYVKFSVGDMALEIPGAQDVDYFVAMIGKMLRKHEKKANL